MSSDASSSGELLRRAKEGDQQALGALFARFSGIDIASNEGHVL
jgi:hypothetical protein